MEDVFWNSLTSNDVFSVVPSEHHVGSAPAADSCAPASRFELLSPEEEIWIPSDQTIHWGKRPNYSYPAVRLVDKDDLPCIPRGSRLVAKLWFSEWQWDEERLVRDENGKRPSKPEPSSTPCFEEDKTIVPFEKGSASFRHLRVSKGIKLKKTETFTIVNLGFEIGYHDPFATTPFKSLEIFLSKPVKIHIVAHKGSVKLMQKYGLLDTSVRNGTGIGGKEADDAPMQDPPTNKRHPQTPSEQEQPKKQKQSEVSEIIEELSRMQERMDELKRRVGSLVPQAPPKGERLVCDTQAFPPSTFVFYALRTRNLELAVNLAAAFHFPMVSRDPIGYTALHVACRSGFLEGARWCLQNGAAVNATSEHRMTPLHLAYVRNDKEVRRLLKQYHADKEAVNGLGLKPRDYRNERKPLSKPVKTFPPSVEVVLPGFEQHPFPLSVWFAARVGWMEVVSACIGKLGVDVDAKTANGQTPLMCACEYKRLDVARYLLDMGADPNARDIHDNTPLHFAVANQTQDPQRVQEIVELLDKYGADKTITNIWHQTPGWQKPSATAHRSFLQFTATSNSLFRSVA